MRIFTKTIIFIACFMIGNKAFSQTVASPFEVGTWQGFKPAAVTYTFDDNCANQLTTVVPMFNNLNFKLTLFAVINWSPNWASLQAAANKGHEVASHTVSHNDLNTLNDADQTTQYVNSKSSINTNITGQTCLTIAYPSCIVGNSTLCSQYYIAARGCQGNVESSTPPNFMNINAITCGANGSVKTSTDFNTRAEEAVTSKGWCVFLMHAMDGESGYSSTQSSELGTHLTYVNTNISKFWVNTFSNVVRYIKERNAVSLAVTSTQANSITIQLTDNLDNAIYNYPISIRRPLPQGWTSATVTQNGSNLSSTVVTVNTVNYIMFDAVPDAGDIVITQSSATAVEPLQSGASLNDITLWQDKDKLLIDLPKSAGTNLDITFYDLNGAILANFKTIRMAKDLVSIDLSKIKMISGIKVVHISDGQSTWAKQVPVF